MSLRDRSGGGGGGANWNYDSNVAQGLGDFEEIAKRQSTEYSKKMKARIGAGILFGACLLFLYLAWSSMSGGFHTGPTAAVADGVIPNLEKECADTSLDQKTINCQDYKAHGICKNPMLGKYKDTHLLVEDFCPKSCGKCDPRDPKYN